MPHASRARTSRSPVARWAAGLAACALTMAAPLTGWVPAAVANTAVTEGPEDGGPPPPAWVAAASDATASPNESAAPDTPHVVLDEVTPWLDEDGAVTLSGRIVNPTAQDFAPSGLSVVRSSSRMSMRDDVNRWGDQQTGAQLLVSAGQEVPEPDPEPDAADDSTDGEDADDEPQLVIPDLPGTIAPGEQTTFTFTIPADQAVPSGSVDSTWGAYGLGATVSGIQGQTSINHTAPAFTVWYPDPGIDPTRLTTVLPVTLDATGTGGGPLIDPDVLERAADPEATGDYAGALSRVVTSARSLPDSVLAVDPRLLVSAAAALDVTTGDSPADPTDASDEDNEDSAADGAEDSGDDPGAHGGSEAHDAPQDDAAQQDDEAASDEDGETASADDEGSPLPTAPGAEAREDHPHLAAWYEDLRDLAGSHETLALPWADAHLTALWHADMGDLADTALDERRLVDDLLGGRTDVVWPAAGTVRTDDLGLIEDTGAGTVILSDSQQPSLTSYTSSANSAITVDGATSAGGAAGTPQLPDDSQPRVLQSLVADSGLAEAAAAQASASRSAVPGEFLALSAAVTAERPYDSRALLLTLPRTSAGSGHAAFADDLAGAPWIEGTTLDALMATEPVARGQLVDPASLVEDGQGDGQQDQSGQQDAAQDGQQDLTGQQDQSGIQPPDEDGARADAESDGMASGAQSVLHELAQKHETGTAAAHAFVDADGVARDMYRALLACTSAGVVDGGRIGDCADAAGSWVTDLADGVKPEPGSSVLLVTGEQAMIPVRVDNATDRSARVRLRVESPTPQLSTELSDIVTLGPGEARSVEVPVRGLANADVRSTVTLLTVDGDALPQRTELLVRVRADWENTATIAIGSVLVVVLVVGLVATIRRGRRKIPENQLAAAMARAKDG